MFKSSKCSNEPITTIPQNQECIFPGRAEGTLKIAAAAVTLRMAVCVNT